MERALAWEVDEDLGLVDEDLPLNYLDDLYSPTLPLTAGAHYLAPADLATAADGYYLVSTAYLFSPIPCVDEDGDGVCDLEDACAATAAGAVVDDDGCSVADSCPCDGDWRSPGAYLACVAHAGIELLDQDRITPRERGALQAEAARSGCGRG